MASLKATIAQSEKRIAQITSNYRQQLQAVGTAPAIDYEAYLTRFQREDGAT